ncbi:hypothetical protein F5Y10DRAFT_264056 [Nemania abortiva]|nr:hypothetical protein F5Y10DRAFT_264056 [Nemania abortiva]
MPVTIRPASHQANAYSGSNFATSSESLLQGSCSREWARSKKVIQSSFGQISDSKIQPSSNGFVRAALLAYNQHHHLTIRPEDVWFTILSQMSIYVNANANANVNTWELPFHVLRHEGRKKLEVVDAGNIDLADFGKVAVWMKWEMEKHILDPDLRRWIMPNFTTTTKDDIVVAAILMMGSMKKYFSHRFSLMCGIPSVTLLGEITDWVDILRRLEKLPHLGRQTKPFGDLLKPVLKYFIRSFQTPDSPVVINFWSKMVHKYGGGSDPEYLSGWITAFCFWDAGGEQLYRDHWVFRGCILDELHYHSVNTSDIPDAYTSVPVTVNDNGTEYKTRMVAGSVGIAVSSRKEQLTILEGDPCLNSLRPVSGWWMYEVRDGDAEHAGEIQRPSSPELGHIIPREGIRVIRYNPQS